MSEIRWEAESLRATAFYNVGDAPEDVERLWDVLMHRRPDQVSSRPNEGIQVAEGSFGGSDKQLQCTIRPERVDWVVRAAPPDPSRPPEGLPTIGPLVATLPPFHDLGTRWLEGSSAIVRLAFGAILLVEADNQQDANKKLSVFLQSVTLDPEDVSDFLYRINRRRTLVSHNEIQVNRISTWTTAQGGSIGFAVAGDGLPQLTRQTGHFACRLELDINTASKLPIPLSGTEATGVFSELVALGTEIADEGDKP